MKQQEMPDPFPTLEKIIALGDFLGECAERYRNNRDMALEFLADCAEQCLYTNISDYWGEDLSIEILKFSDDTRDSASSYD